jgi:hypothetical protein
MRQIHLAVLILLLSGVAYSQEKHERWIYITAASEGRRLYYERNIKHRKNGNLLVWEKLVRSDNTQSLYQVEYDCTNERSRVLSYSGSDREGREIKSNRQASLRWSALIPNSIGEQRFEMICRAGRK